MLNHRLSLGSGLLAAILLASGCPASNPCDPLAAPGTRAPGVVKAEVRIKLGANAVAPSALEGFDVDRLKVSVDDGAPASIPASGDIALEVEQGNHTIAIFDSAPDDNLGARTFAPVTVGACLEQSLGTVEFVDRTAPSPVLIEPLPERTTALSVEVVLASPSSDAAGNFASYQLALNDGAYTVLTDFVAAGDSHAVDLVPNQLNVIRLRAVDAVGNASAELTYSVIHDDAPPDVSSAVLVAEAGPARVDLSWSLDDAALADVASFFVHYGPSPGSLNGASANEGVSPILIPSASARAFRLSGLTNGNPLYVTVEAVDANDNRGVFLSDPIRVLPNEVTPEPIATVALTEVAAPDDEDPTFVGATAAVSDGAFVYAIIDSGTSRTVKVVDARSSNTLSDGFTLNAALDDVTDLALSGRLLIVSRGTSGVSVYDVTDPRAPVSLVAPLITELTPCNTGDCRAVSVTTRDGAAWVAVTRYPEDANLANAAEVAGLAGLERGLWRIDLRDPTNIVTVGDLFQLDLDDFTGAASDLKGPMKLFGRYLAIGQRYVRPTPLYGDVNVPDAVLIVDLEAIGAPEACTRFAPTSDNKFSEILAATGAEATEAELPNLLHFDVAGSYLFAPYGGDVVMLDMNAPTTLGNDCAGAAGAGQVTLKTSADSVLGSYSLGLRRPLAVTAAGGFMYVASQPAYVQLNAPPRLDVVSLDNRQASPGADNGIPNALRRVGEVDVSSHGAGPILADGPFAFSAGRNLVRIEMFSASAPQLVASANENPTGMNVGMGPYIVHQRTERGIGVWDVSVPEAPALVNAGTCFPGCFDEQHLAGDAFLDGGYLYSAFRNGDPAPIYFSVVDVASTPQAPATWRVSLDNPCTNNGDIRGVARDGHHLFVGCGSEAEVHVIDLSNDNLVTVPERALPNDVLIAPVRDLAFARIDVDGTLRLVLLVLDADGRLYFFDASAMSAAPTAIASRPTINFGAAEPEGRGFDYAQRLRVTGSHALVLGGTSADMCDPVVAAACTVTENKLGVVALDDSASGVLTVEVAGTGTDVTNGPLGGEREQLIRTYGDLLVLTRDDGTTNPYYLYALDFDADAAALEVRGVAEPNALPLEGTIHGGHLFGASFNIFALE